MFKNHSIVILCFSVSCLIGFPSNSHAQTPAGAKVSARISAADKTTLDLASVLLLQAADSSFVKSSVPDQEGVIEFANVPAGNYLVAVVLVGYQKKYSAPFAVGDQLPDIRLPDIQLVENALAEVTIAAKKPFIERKLDRLIVNVDNSILNAGSSLLEVLERSPNITVNQDAGLQMRGKAGALVMIDGRPTPLAGADLINYLRSIPSANIDRIEIISNPSAKYDAAGNAGIIDIKFKKDKNEGLNGSLALGYGQGFYGKPSASVNLNFRNKKVNIFSNYSFSSPKGFTRFYINRKFFNEDRSVNAVFDQTSFIKQPIYSHVAKLGMDYYASKKTIIGVLLNTNVTNLDRIGFTESVITDANGALQYTTLTDNVLKAKNLNGFANANLKHDFDGKGTELTVDLDLGQFAAENFQNFNSGYFDAAGNPTSLSTLETDQEGTITVQSIKADFARTLADQSKLEAGLKSSFVKTDNDIVFYDIIGGNPVLDTLHSNHFIYDENVNAAYVNYMREMKKIDIQVGLRMEHTATHGEQVTTGETFSREYVNLFPSVTINRKFSEKYQMGLSYSRRIDRPSYRQLNPFRLFVDPYTYVVGDPRLKPTFTNAITWSHTYKGRYIAEIGFARSKDVITDIFEQDDDTKISNQIPANIQDFDYVSVGITIPFSYKKWLNSSMAAEAYWGKYSSPLQGGQLLNENVTWNARLNNAITLGKKGWSMELNAMYRAREAWGLFIIRDYAFLSTGIQKVSADKNTTFKLSIADIFYTNRIAVVVQYQNMDFYTNRTWDGRTATLSLSHRFGKKTVAQARRRSSGVEDEKRRAN